jgi:hypothetical protein
MFIHCPHCSHKISQTTRNGAAPFILVCPFCSWWLVVRGLAGGVAIVQDVAADAAQAAELGEKVKPAGSGQDELR